MRQLLRRQTYYPVVTEAGNFTTSMAMQLIRVSDGFYYDFNDSTFKDAAWTTKQAAMTEKTDGEWVYTTGVQMPNATEQYKAIFIDDGGTTTQEEFIDVSGGPVGLVVADAGNTATTFKTDIPMNADNDVAGRFIEIRTGTQINETKKVDSNVAATGFITLQTALTGTPANGVEISLIP